MEQPPPEWLSTAIAELHVSHPADRFEIMMRYTAYDPLTDNPLPPHSTNPNAKFKYSPRIRCHDCPGKLYTPGPSQSIENFLTHLKNRGHRSVSPFLNRSGTIVLIAGCLVGIENVWSRGSSCRANLQSGHNWGGFFFLFSLVLFLFLSLQTQFLLLARLLIFLQNFFFLFIPNRPTDPGPHRTQTNTGTHRKPIDEKSFLSNFVRILSLFIGRCETAAMNLISSHSSGYNFKKANTFK